MVKSLSERVRESEDARRARGEKQIRVWVPADPPEDEQAVRSLARELCTKRSPKSP